MKFKTGDIVFCCKQDMESEGYEMDGPPVLPWLGKVYTDSRMSPMMQVHWFDSSTGEIDDDSNATALVNESQVFDNFDDAWKFYLGAVEKFIVDLDCRRADLVDSMSDASRDKRRAAILKMSKPAEV